MGGPRLLIWEQPQFFLPNIWNSTKRFLSFDGCLLKSCLSSSLFHPSIFTYLRLSPPLSDEKPYDTSVDVYSCGIVFWEILTCQIPFHHLQDKHLTDIYKLISVSISFLLKSFSAQFAKTERREATITYCYRPNRRAIHLNHQGLLGSKRCSGM